MQRAQGFAQQGDVKVYTNDIPSTTVVEGSYPLCTVTVYDAGTLNLSTIYSDNASTPLANPFTSQANGYWYFYALNGRYDVKFSGVGIAVPFTLGDVLLADPSEDPITYPISIAHGGTGQTTRITAKSAAGLNFPFLVASDFAFSGVTPTSPSSLSIGSNSLTFATLPLGLSIGNVVYVSGTGTPEACAITGISGSNVIITCAHTHTTGFVVSTASGGAQEACQYLAGPGLVLMGPGNINSYGVCNIPAGVYVKGCGVDSTNILTNLVGGDVFSLNGEGCGVSGMTIDTAVGSRTGYGVNSASNLKYLYMADLLIQHQGIGLAMNSAGFISQVVVGYSNDTGIILNFGEVYFHEVQSNSNINYGVKILSGTGVYMQHPQATQNGISNFYIPPGSASNILIIADQMVSSLTGSGHGIDLRGAGGNLNFFLTNPFVEQAGRLSPSNTVDCAGIVWEAAGSIQIVGGSISGNNGPGVVAGPSGGVTMAMVINGVLLNGNGLNTTLSDDSVGIKLTGVVAWESITGNVFKTIEVSPGVFKQVHAFSISSATINNGLQINSNYIDAHLSPFYPTAAGSYEVVNRELQIQPNYWSKTALASYASTATLVVAPEDDSVIITGTTTVTTLRDAWLNRSITFIKKDTGTVIIMGRSLTQNNKVNLTFDGSNWI